MTDLEICEQLAERVHGWKIAPAVWSEREGFFDDDANFPCLDGVVWRADFGDFGTPWHPFDDWEDAMALAEKWAMQEPENWHRGVIIAGFPKHPEPWDCSLYEEYETGPGHENWILEKDTVVKDKSGPKAVAMAVARAAGIEVEK